MNDDKRPLIVVRKIKRVTGGHNGGAWKIAYADFVTAMMAFFLLMWLLGSTTKGDLQGIAEYFRNPVKVSLRGGSGAGDASSVVQAGGRDLSRKEGQVLRGDSTAERRIINIKAAEAERAKQEAARLRELKARMEAAIEASPGLQPFKDQLRLDLTSEGLRIQILDEQSRPMFDIGSAQLKDYTRVILREIGRFLNDVDHKLMLSGHTDASPYAFGERGYSNWELSADRANASRRELVAGGMDEKKILRVVGQSSAVPFHADNPLHPSNRRISIIVTNRRTEETVRRGGSIQEAEDTKTLQEGSPGVPAGGAVPNGSAAHLPGTPAGKEAPGEPGGRTAAGRPPAFAKALSTTAVNSEGWPATR